jgi:hypothetical protein
MFLFMMVLSLSISGRICPRELPQAGLQEMRIPGAGRDIRRRNGGGVLRVLFERSWSYPKKASVTSPWSRGLA